MKILLSCDGTLGRRAVKMNLANEGFEARKKEEEVTAKKRKAEDDARWEGTVLYHSYMSFLAILMPTLQKPGNSAWTVGVPSPIHRKRRRNRRATFLAEVLFRFGVRAVSVPVHITPW
jgi:hypothetical protein